MYHHQTTAMWPCARHSRQVFPPLMALQVLHGMETVESGVAVASGAIPSALVLSSSGLPVATSRIHLASGAAEVR